MQKLISLLSKFAGRKVLVIGDVMLDKYVLGDVKRISPEAPVQVVNVKEEKYLPGGAANVAVNIASLKARPYLIGVMGRDSAGDILQSELKKQHIDANLFKEDRPTTQKVRIVARSQQLLRADYESDASIGRDMEKDIINCVREKIALVENVVVCDYAKGTITKGLMNFLVKTCSKQKKKLLVDPKPRNFTYYKGAYVITPNLSEAKQINNIYGGTEITAEELGRKIQKKLGCNILIKLGERGCMLYESRGTELLINSKKREVYDVTGAGDTLIAALAVALAAGADLENAAKIANAAAGIVVEKFGAATTTIEELASDLR